MLHQQSDETHKGIESVEAFGPDERRSVVRAGFPERTVTQIHTHLRTQAEEAGDEVVRFQDTLLVHLQQTTNIYQLF